MGSGHNHNHSMGNGTGALQKALWITFAFMLIELAGGWIANSLALITDAVHMATDIGSLLLALFVAWLAKKPPQGRMTYGYYRAEILGALISGLALWAICGVIVYEAIQRALNPHNVNGPLVVLIALIAIGMNLLTMRFLHGSHKESMNLRAAYLHVLSDLLANLGTLAAGIIVWTTGWMPIDPILSCFIAILIVISAWRMIREAIEILMQASPRSVDLTQIEESLKELSMVQEIHDLHVWTLSTGKLALSVHLLSDSPSETLERAQALLREKYGIHYHTIQIEDPNSFDSTHCFS